MAVMWWCSWKSRMSRKDWCDVMMVEWFTHVLASLHLLSTFNIIAGFSSKLLHVLHTICCSPTSGFFTWLTQIRQSESIHNLTLVSSYDWFIFYTEQKMRGHNSTTAPSFDQNTCITNDHQTCNATFLNRNIETTACATAAWSSLLQKVGRRINDPTA